MSIIRNSLFVTLSILSGRGAVLLVGMLISNALGSAAFAIFAFAHVTATSLSNIATVGMQNALPRYFARLEIDDKGKSLSHTLMGFLFASIGLSFAALSIIVLPQEIIGLPEPATKTLLAVLLCTVGINNLSVGAANGLERFSLVSVATLVQGGLLLVVAVFSIYWGRVDIALWGYVIVTLITTAILMPDILNLLIIRIHRQKILLDFSCAKDVASFCWPLFLSTILFNSGVWLSGRLLLREDNDLHHYAEFALGLQWFGLASLATAVIGRVVLPRITKLGFLKEIKEGKKALSQGLLLSGLSTATFWIFVFIFSDIILALYNINSSSAKLTLLFFVAAAVIASPIDIVASALMSIDKQLYIAVSVLAWWFALISFSFFFVDLGAIGISLGFMFSYIISTSIFFLIARRHKFIAL